MIDWNRVCPFCGSVMIGTNGHPICHSNPDCVIHDESIPQELLDKLEATKKALDVAKEGLKEIQDKGEYVNPIELAESYLDEITALEQKD